jgi:hypothetical protein
MGARADEGLTINKNDVGPRREKVRRVPIDVLLQSGIDIDSERVRPWFNVGGMQRPFVVRIDLQEWAQPSIERVHFDSSLFWRCWDVESL